MNIGRQWSDRLRIWAQELPRHYAHTAQTIALTGFTTMEHLPYAEAVQRAFAPVSPGEKWGRKWEYGWFRGTVVIPQALSGERLVVTLGVGEEMLVWVNGEERGAIDKKHGFIPLCREAKAGDVYEIVAECYAGHGVRNEGAGPVAPGDVPVPEPPEAQQTVRESCLMVWNEPVFQAAMDYLTLYSLLPRLPEKSLRAMRVAQGLKRFTLTADFELPRAQMTQSVVEAAKALAPLLACRNGDTAPEYTVFGQSHLDMAWLWPLEETVRKTARTYANQLALMEEYPEYRFLMCEPPILEILKAHYPNVHARVMEKVAQGAFMPEGALWIEADTNIPSGESLIRQFVRGKRWFRVHARTDSRMAWMPDTFGFSAALPQIMQKCQVPYFATQKLLRQDPEAEPFPYNLFWWEGMDGSRVLAHIFKKNNAVFQAGDLIARWEDDRIQQEGISGMMFPFGYGDGGGGPTREMVEMARRCADLEGAPRCRMENPVRYFERAIGEGVENTFCGELYLAWHRGTLTAQAKTKRGIRKAEVALRHAQYHIAVHALTGNAVKKEWLAQIEAWWSQLLFNQFHDIAPGTSIARVHERAERELGGIVAGCDALLSELLGTPEGKRYAVNPLSFPRRYRGVEIPAQGAAEIPAERPRRNRARAFEAGEIFILQNRWLTCCVNRRGEVVSLRRAQDDREHMADAGNRFLMLKDVNTCYDAWEIGAMAELQPVPLDGPVDVTIEETEDGAALRVSRMLHDSPMTQRILLGDDAQRVDFITRIDWRERHKLLKVAFPVNAYATEALHEIQFGYVKRPTHRSYQTDRDRYEVCSHRYTVIADAGGGAAVLNDGKYGVSAVGQEIRLTLLRAPMMPDMYADIGVQETTYAIYPFAGPFAQSGVLREAADLNEPLRFAAAPQAACAVLVPQQENIVVETIALSDTREGALLVRAYEAMGAATDAAFAVSPRIGRIEETDMLEEHARPLTHDGTLRVHFGSFEIKTFLLNAGN